MSNLSMVVIGVVSLPPERLIEDVKRLGIDAGIEIYGEGEFRIRFYSQEDMNLYKMFGNIHGSEHIYPDQTTYVFGLRK